MNDNTPFVFVLDDGRNLTGNGEHPKMTWGGQEGKGRTT
jgi:hypothetical protein